MGLKTRKILVTGRRHPFWPRSCLVLALLLLVTGFLTRPAQAIRLKDIASFKGVRPNQLIGNGLVVGLNGTGDGTNVDFNKQELVNMLMNLGVHADLDKVKVKNIAAVAVTAMLPAFARVGSRIDVLVSSMGDAKSLQGGTLLLTPIKGVDQQVYALAQGPVSVGGFTASGEAGGGGYQKPSHRGADCQRRHRRAGNSPGPARQR